MFFTVINVNICDNDDIMEKTIGRKIGAQNYSLLNVKWMQLNKLTGKRFSSLLKKVSNLRGIYLIANKY